MNNSSFYDELTQMVVRRASSMYVVDTMAFADEAAERLADDPVFGHFQPIEYSGTGRHNRRIRLHGFTELDEADGTLGLVAVNWSDHDELETMTSSMVDQMTSWLTTFVAESVENSLADRITEANPAYELACLLRDRGHMINRIRLHLFSNQKLSSKFKEEMLESIGDIPIERHIWDFQRLESLYRSRQEREAVEINLEDFSSEGIPCIKAASTDRLESYLCVIKGNLLADLFEKYGSRLLEGNVRSFLGMKGGVNKGIRATIQHEPSLFFAYNNGIAATAASVVVERTERGLYIKSLVDLQIVNGGQTTASILNARKKERLSLENVSVQMKLTAVEATDANLLIPKIAQFANTQNKVAIADFFANHPFHRKMEEISRRLTVPARPGVRVQSKWFYERARGQYQNERLYLTEAKKAAFDLEYPSIQVINKTDLAKYDSVRDGKPFWASQGAQKNFTKFAGKFSSSRVDETENEYWDRVSANFGDAYYQDMASIGILWKFTEKMVSAARGDWYEGDYRIQIVSYTLALLFHLFRQASHEFNLAEIWKKQEVDPQTGELLEKIAQAVQDEILDPPPGTTNVGEWTKKDGCWDRVKDLRINIKHMLAEHALDKEEFRTAKTQARKQGAEDDEITLQSELYTLSKAGYFLKLLKWPDLTMHVTPGELKLTKSASTERGFLSIHSHLSRKQLMDVKNRCESEAFRA